MLGGKKVQKQKKSTKYEDEENLDFNDDEDLDFDDDDFEDYDEDEDEDLKESKPSKKIKKKNIQPVNMDSDSNQQTVIYVCIGVIVILIIVVVVFFMKAKNADKVITEVRESAQEEIDKIQENNKKDDHQIKPTAPDLSDNNSKQNNKVLSDPNQILKDLNGQSTEIDYKIKSLAKAVDFINYEKYRATLGDGIEYYWLEAMYKNKPYKIQVPLKIWKEMEPEGITVVDVESAKTEDNKEFVTFMKVREDYKDILKRGKTS